MVGGENVLELERAELLVYHLPDNLVGCRHYELVIRMLAVNASHT
jgi:hypothetical protein